MTKPFYVRHFYVLYCEYLRNVYHIEKTAEVSNEEETTALEEDVTWDLKWSQDEKAEIHGPHTSQQMHAWAKEGYFKKGAWVRRTGQQNQFYNASRVDFELYL